MDCQNNTVGFEKYTGASLTGSADSAPTYLLLPLDKWGSKRGDSIGQWGMFNHEKGAIWQSHLAAQKEGFVTTS